MFREYVYNVFSAGLFFYSFLNIVGMILNPSSVVSYSGFFYILGSLVFLLIVADFLR